MSSDDIKQVREMLASLPNETGLSIEERRAIFDNLGQQMPVPEGVSVTKTVAGGVNAEWVRAENTGIDAAILYLHGGGYRIGSPTSHRHLVAAISQSIGAAALAIDYRLAPEFPFPAAVEDAVSAYQWLIEQSIAPGRIVIAGDSAGGGLTVATLIALRERNLPLPAAGVCLSPWVDLTITAESYETRADVDPILTREELLMMAQTYLNGQDAKTPLASPLFADLQGLPPLLIQAGTDEVLVDDSVKLEASAKMSGVDVKLEIWDEMPHVWHYFFPMLQQARTAIARIGEFAKTQMKLA
jgi:phosphinothricin tripeptide acetyl hydrolase